MKRFGGTNNILITKTIIKMKDFMLITTSIICIIIDFWLYENGGKTENGTLFIMLIIFIYGLFCFLCTDFFKLLTDDNIK